ncbi:hypothetical protein [Kordia sp.]|uniref:hypothetical protein n=1 Tax=Kordia sp. TaxID=1965332 RepID=UPI003B5CA299
MSIFSYKTKKKHIEQFALAIAELLQTELPELKTVITLSQVHGISFTKQPSGIYIATKYTPEDYKIIQDAHQTCFNLTGISVFHKKEKRFVSIPLYYQSDCLTRITVERPEYFHKTFDLSKIQKSEIKLEQLKIENSNNNTVEEILQSLTTEQLNLLELTASFEIELDEKIYYTILDLEDGNYVAIDEKGKVYRLIHDHEIPVKLIANTPADFFKFYTGQKDELNLITY